MQTMTEDTVVYPETPSILNERNIRIDPDSAPSDEELLRRLRERRRENEASIQRRFDEARREIAFAKGSSVYDAHIVNDDLERAIDDACCLINHRRTMNQG